MKRVSVVALSFAAAAFTLLITQLAPAQAAPSNATPCSMNETVPAYYVGGEWFNTYLAQPCMVMQQAAPSDYTSSAAEQDTTSPEAMQRAMELVPAQAYLDQTVDATKVRQGDQIKATLDNSIQLQKRS